MIVAGRRETLPEVESAAIEGQRPDVATAGDMYLKLAGREPRRALALAVADAIDASKLVSRGSRGGGTPTASRDRFGAWKRPRPFPSTRGSSFGSAATHAAERAVTA
jgi:hypothetical protein